MLRDREATLDAVVAALARSSTPMGTRSAQRALAAAGYEVSESSASRLLAELDRRDLTTPAGHKGRVLTATGREHARRLMSTHEIGAPIDIREVADVLDLLRARLLVESSIAADAARHCTESDELVLRRLWSDHRDAKDPESLRKQPGLQLHRHIARMTTSKMLRTLSDVLLSPQFDHVEAMLDLVLGEESRETDVPVVDHHQEIIDAIIARDAAKAESAMRRHFSSMIEEVETFLVGRNESFFRRLLAWFESESSQYEPAPAD